MIFKRFRRRSLRRLVLLITATLVIASVADPAMAVSAKVTTPDLPLPDAAGFLPWLTGKPNPAFGRLPRQLSGTAAGHGHRVSADATRANRGVGRPRKNGKGELPLYSPPAPKVAKGPSGKHIVGFRGDTSKRVASKSSATSDYYQNADGSFTRRMAQGLINYRDASGDWQPIDTSLGTGQGNRLKEKSNSVAVDFAPSAADPALVRLGFDADHSLAYGLQGAASVAPAVTGSTASYPGVLPGTDLTLTATPGGTKESLILRSANAGNTWVFPLDAKQLTAAQASDGSIRLMDASGKTRLVIPPAYAYDSKINRRSGDPATTHAISYRLDTTGGRAALVVTLDSAWLHAKDRVFPVTVDPTTSFAQSSITTYAQTTAPGDHSMEQLLKIGSWNAGPDSAISFMQFPGLGLDGSGATVQSASLNLFATWASTCTAERFDVAPITQGWTASQVKVYPGPSIGGSVGNATVSVPHACANTAADPGVGDSISVPFSTAGINQLQTWAKSGGSSDYGFAVYASTTDNLHWKKFASANDYAGSAIPPQLYVTYYGAALLPVVTAQSTATGVGGAATLTPMLQAQGTIDANLTGKTAQFDFRVFDSSGNQVVDSGLVSGVNKGGTWCASWAVPAGKLKWGQSYYWGAVDYDGTNYSASPSWTPYTPQVPQPAVTSSLSQNGDSRGFDPAAGNYTTSATDANVGTVGPALSLVRNYNSRDPRVSGAFGAAWSSVLDAKAAEQYDSSGAVQSVAVTYPEGSTVGYGKNSDGSFSPPQGRFATFRSVTGGYSLTDKNNTTYTFTQALGSGAYGITSISDAKGRAETFTWTAGKIATATSGASGRALHFTWSTPSGASYSHVGTLYTDPVTAGNWATALTWTYTYTGDQLTKVCSPVDTSGCTQYGYTNGSLYHNQVLDSGASSFWPMAESSGSTAASAIVANEGLDNATYSGVTLGQPGPLAGGSATAAGFNGTSSYVQMPNLHMNVPNDLSISLWFKTSVVAPQMLFGYSTPALSAGTTTSYTPVMYIGTDGKLKGMFWANQSGNPTPLSTSGSVADGHWHHVVLSGSTTAQTMWVDGQQVGSMSGSIANAFQYPPTWSANTYLGAGFLGGLWPDQPHNTSDTGYATYFNGSIADASYFGRALTQGTVTALYNAGTHATGLLTSVTRPSGNAYSAVTYDPITTTVTHVTDDQGGSWGIAAPTVTGSSQVYRAAVLGSAPAHYFRLGDGAGATQASDEVHSGPAAYSNVTLGSGGPFSDATGASFNGTSSYVQLPLNDQVQTSAGSVEMWFSMPAGNTAGGVLYDEEANPVGPASSGYVPALYVGTDGKLHGKFWDANGPSNGVVSSAPVNDGLWHHVVLAVTNNSQNMYLDGVSQGTLSAALSTTPVSYSYVGAGMSGGTWPNHPTNTAGYFPGSIAEVAFYHSQLSGQDVARHYRAGKNSAGLAPVETVTVSDPGGKTITYQYDPWNGNRKIAKIDALGGKTTYGYDSGGFLNTVTDPNGNVTITGHDVRGNQVSQTACQNQATQACSTSYTSYLPDDTSTQLTPNATNDLISTTSDGRSASATDTTYQTIYAYDTLGDRTVVVTPVVPGFTEGRKTRVSYTDGTSIPAADSGYAPPGLPFKTLSPGGAISTISYLHNGDVASVTDAAGKVTKFSYDNLGRVLTKTVISDTYPSGLTTSYVYNGMGLVTQETDPAVTDRVTGAVHTPVTTRVYDADGQVTSQTVADTTGGDASRTTKTAYNSYGLVSSTTDANSLTTTLTYDAYGNKATELDPSGTTTAYAYDPNGNVLTQTLKGYTGDPNNPQTAKDLVESSRAYDPAGRLASITDSMGNTTAYTYTDNGLVASITRTDATGKNSFVQKSTSYDGAGNPIKQVTNNGATTVTQVVDAADRTNSTTVDPNGVNRTTTLSYTADDQVATSTVKDGSNTTHVTSSTYDPMGRVTSRSIQEDGAGHPSGWWQLSQTSGATVADSSGTGNTAALASNPAYESGSASWASGAARFDGTTGEVSPNGQVLTTASSYAVSAWVNLADTSVDRTFVTQNGTNWGSFYLKYSHSLNGWEFVSPNADTSSVTWNSAHTTTGVPLNTWTHLAGVFDAGSHTMSLYVNGTLAATATNNTPWTSSGSLVFGAAKYPTTTSDFMKGLIGNVQVYAHTLSAADVSTINSAGRSGTTTPSQPAGWWQLNATSGSRALDSANAGVGWAGQAASFQSIPGQQIATNGPVLNTATSFSVSAWVNMASAVTSGSETAVSQDATTSAGFILKYDSGPKTWNFMRAQSDSNSPPFASALGKSPATTGTWTHLVGVFNSADGSMVLYVNGVAQGTASDTTPIASNGSFVIGRAHWNGANVDQWNGSVSNVQAYPRVLSAAEVGTLFNAGRTGGTTASTTTATTKWALDQRGLATSMADPDGNVTNYTYDEAGHLAVTSGATVNVETGGGTPTPQHPVSMTGYDTFGEKVETQDPNGNTTVTAYDAGGRKVKQTLPSYTPPGSSTPISASQSWAYDTIGNITDVTDPLSNKTHYVYDQLGDVASVTDANNGVTKYVYDTNGQKLSSTTPSGAQTQATYDFLGRQVTTTVLDRYPTATSSTTTSSYAASATNPGGAFLAATTTQNGVTTSYGYDNVGEKTQITDPAGATSHITYDLLGHKTAVKQADGTATLISYDQLNDVLSTKQTDTDGVTVLSGTSATYDAAGRQLSATDARGNTSTFTRDARGLITQETQPLDASHSITTGFGYDASGNRTRYTDGRSNSWIYTYNSWSKPESAIEPATATYTASADRTSAISYDADGRPVTQTAPGGVSISIGYDNLGNVTSQSGTGADAATATRSFTYDGDNRMLTAGTTSTGSSVPATSETFTYNDRSAVLTTSGSAGSSSFAYNGDGLPTSRTDAAGTTSYTYDNADRPATLTDPATGTQLTYGYDTVSQLTSISYGSGGNTRSYGYDHLHRLTSDTLKTATGTTIASIGYGYDLNGNETSKTTTGFTGSAANTYTYDYANRLTSWNNGTTTTNYGYDASGNRIQVGANVYTYDARDQLTSDGVNSYTYTARGTLATQTRAGTTLNSTSDAFGQQVTQDTATAGTRTYVTDALGRMTSASGAGGTSAFSYSGTGDTLASDGTNTYTHDAAGSLIGINTVGGGTATGVLAYTDAHTDVVGNFTATGTALAASTTYDPLGNSTAGGGLSGKLGYQSGWTDNASGKVNMAARWYNPAVGQFQNKDTASLSPIPNSIAANPFAYVDANPLTRTDPSGHGWWDDVTSTVSDAVDTVSSYASDAYNTASDWVSSAYDTVSGWVSDAYDAVSSWVSDAYDTVSNWVSDTVNTVSTYVSDSYNWAVHKAEEAAAAARRAAAWAAAKAKDAYDKLHEIGKYAGTVVMKAVRTTATFVKNHAAAIASFAVSAAVFTGCEGAVTFFTAGTLSVPGAMACGALAGAAGGLVNQGIQCANGQKGACSVSAFGQAALIGGVGGAVGGGVGGAVGGLIARTALGDVLPGVVADVVSGVAAGGVAGAAGGAVTYGITCSETTAGCSWSGLANAAEEGGKYGAITGGLFARSGGREGCHSFTATTAVLMADHTSKPISQVKVGDKVANAVPGDKGTPETHTVDAVIVTRTDHDFVDLTIATQDDQGRPVGVGKITTTSTHPFYDITQAAFVDAAHLKAGDKLQQPGGHTATILGVRHYQDVKVTYDLTINGLHTYYVETSAGDPVLVHNCGTEPGGYDDAALAQQRAADLQNARGAATNDHWDAQALGTTAVIGVRNTKTGDLTIRVGINGNGEMPNSWSLGSGEEFVQAPGHAEEGILNSLGKHEVAEFGGTSRNICEETCYPLLNRPGIVIGGPEFPGNDDKTPYRMFWTDPEAAGGVNLP